MQQAESAVVAAKTQVVAAEQQEQTDAAAGRVSIENARQGVVSAQNDRDSASSDRPFNVAEQQALVDDARAGVAGARRDVDETVLTAPVAGVVAAINGVPGEFVPAPSGVTAQGPGGSAAAPGWPTSPGRPPTSCRRPAPSWCCPRRTRSRWWCRSRRPTRPGWWSASRWTSGARRGARSAALHGRVLAIAPTGQDLNGIVSFYTTISIEDPIDRLRSGQTADAAVRTQVAPERAAGADRGGRPHRRPAQRDRHRAGRRPGDGAVRAGPGRRRLHRGALRAAPGQDVRLPQATVTAAPDRGGPRRRPRSPRRSARPFGARSRRWRRAPGECNGAADQSAGAAAGTPSLAGDRPSRSSRAGREPKPGAPTGAGGVRSVRRLRSQVPASAVDRGQQGGLGGRWRWSWRSSCGGRSGRPQFGVERLGDQRYGRARSPDQVVLHGEHGRAGPGAAAGLVVDVRQMGLHGALGDRQLVGDLPVGRARGRPAAAPRTSRSVSSHGQAGRGRGSPAASITAPQASRSSRPAAASAISTPGGLVAAVRPGGAGGPRSARRTRPRRPAAGPAADSSPARAPRW